MSSAAKLLAVVALVLLATAPAAAAKKVAYGTMSQDGALPSPEDLDLMPGGGIDGLRIQMPWGLVESKRGEPYDWSQVDAVVRETTNRGIAPFPFFYGTPEWAAKQDGRNCSGYECSVYPPRSAESRAAFAAFAAAAVARYGPGGDFWEAPVQNAATTTDAADPRGAALPVVGCPLPILCPPPPPPPPVPIPDPPLPTEPPCKCTQPHPITTWQIWNEQNSFKYFAPDPDVRLYAGILGDLAAAIRSVDPGAEIVLGGMWGPRSARKVVTPVRRYLGKLYGIDGAAASFDSIAIHPYASGARKSLDQLESARRAVKNAGDKKAALWVTEIGWAAGGPRSNPYVKGLMGQARVLTRALSAYERERRSLRLRGVFWYSWRDKDGGETICEWCGHAGLRAKGGEEKPAWQAFARLARR